MSTITGTNRADRLKGTSKSDVIFGLNGADRLDGGGGDDTLNGGAGADTIVGGSGLDVVDFSGALGGVTLDFNVASGGFASARVDRDGDGVVDEIDRIEVSNRGDGGIEGARGGAGSDRFTGNARANLFLGGAGNDAYVGGAGVDTVSYEGLGARVTLATAGQVIKDGLGTDALGRFVGGPFEVIERVIGASGFRNLVDGSSRTGAVGIQVDLAAQSFGATVTAANPFGLAVGTGFGFRIVNFVDVKGTNNGDSILGDGAANVFFGSLGDDAFNGRGGVDAIDYTGLGLDVTLLANGLIRKGSAGVDTLSGDGAAEIVVADAARTNRIDGFLAGGGPPGLSFDVDLGADRLTVKNLPGLGDRTFTVRNFEEVRGASGDDVIRGGGAGPTNLFLGSAGNDAYFFEPTPGGAQTAVVDYSGLGARVTLQTGGRVVKNGLGVDTLGTFDFANGVVKTVDKVVGASGQRNLIDGTSVVGAVNVQVDLGSGAFAAEVVKLQPGSGFALGDRIEIEVENFRDVRGTDNDDDITGDALGNTFFGSKGEDVYAGGASGFDVVDYSALGERIILLAAGSIRKGGDAGVDRLLFGVDGVIGAVGERNLIDGFAPSGDAAGVAFDVDLGDQRLTVKNLPVVGDQTFAVAGFTDVRGTTNADTVTGDGADNLFIASAGSDRYAGGAGSDTLDYTPFAQAVTLRAAGSITKADGSTDLLLSSIETIVGAAGEDNRIDGTAPFPSAARFDVDLAAERLTVRDISPGSVDATFTIRNFDTVTGTRNADAIRGDADANLFLGSAGNDSVTGGGGFDTIDYSGLGTAVTLRTGGVVDKGALGVDRLGAFSNADGTIEVIEKVIGGAGSVVDGSSVQGLVNIEVDLAAGTFQSTVVESGAPFIAFPIGAGFGFQIVNFVDVIGTDNDDVVRGDGAANVLTGGLGGDTLTGRGGADRFVLDFDDSLDFVTDVQHGLDLIELRGGFGSLGGLTLDAAALTTDRIIDGGLSDLRVDFDAATVRTTLTLIDGGAQTDFAVIGFV
jgi:Ca2+-binding RTX toxin-like protein